MSMWPRNRVWLSENYEMSECVPNPNEVIEPYVNSNIPIHSCAHSPSRSITRFDQDIKIVFLNTWRNLCGGLLRHTAYKRNDTSRALAPQQSRSKSVSRTPRQPYDQDL